MDKILFLDDFWVRSKRGLRRAFHAADKCPANPVLRPTEPWEERRVYLFGSVLPVNGHYRMWYQTCSNRLEGPDKALVCVADSEDLIRWHKPPIGPEAFRGRNHNNIVLKCTGPKPLYSPSVLLDDSDPDPARRYKMLFWDSQGRGRGACAAFSPDGLRWRRQGSEPLFREPNDVLVTARDPHGRFICYQTMLIDDPSQLYPRDNLRGRRRVVGRRVSDDFLDWREAEPVLQPDGLDPPDTQFYGMAAAREGGVWIGLLWTYHAESQTSDVQLAWSREGRRWARPYPREPLIRLGRAGEFDSHLIYTASAPVARQGKTHIFYGGFDGPHDSSTRSAAIGLSMLREDGWCSLDAGDEEAELTTSPLPFSTRGLSLNIDATEGFCSAELIDLSTGTPLPGCSFAESILLSHTDSRDAPLLWENGPPPDIPARDSALRLRLRNASLFSVKPGC